MIEISSFERIEYEKMMETLGLKEMENPNYGEIKYPDRDYLMAWGFGYVKKNGMNGIETA